MPALVLRGERDGVASAAYARAFASRLPDARVQEIPGAAHYPMLEQPAAFAAVSHRCRSTVKRW